MYTVWLFTFSDLKTIVGPSTVFGVVSALAGSTFTPNPMSCSYIIERSPIVAFWAWINLLPFAIDNQRQQRSIQEDMVNKAWRPLPSKRLSARRAKMLMLFSYFLALLSSHYLGGVRQCLVLMILGYWYNDLKGADRSCIIRNFINSCGYICYTSGALEVATDSHKASLKAVGYRWLVTIGLVILTTIQSQDLYDQAGDALRGRWTIPLVIGDAAARWTVALPVVLWSFLCPAFWQVPFTAYIVSISLALLIAWRILSKRTVVADKRTFRIYNVWVISLYMLPLIKHLSND